VVEGKVDVEASAQTGVSSNSARDDLLSIRWIAEISTETDNNMFQQHGPDQYARGSSHPHPCLYLMAVLLPGVSMSQYARIRCPRG
jgi:hypothetical protein